MKVVLAESHGKRRIGLTSWTPKITKPAAAEEIKVSILIPLYCVAAVVVLADAAGDVVEDAMEVVADMMVVVEMSLSKLS